jgi:hypothetical protein
VRRHLRTLSLAIPIFFLLVLSVGAAQTSSCVTCHTSEAILKAMVKPPEMGAEGEG